MKAKKVFDYFLSTPEKRNIVQLKWSNGVFDNFLSTPEKSSIGQLKWSNGLKDGEYK